MQRKVGTGDTIDTPLHSRTLQTILLASSYRFEALLLRYLVSGICGSKQSKILDQVGIVNAVVNIVGIFTHAPI